MKKILNAIWKWLKGLFYFPPEPPEDAEDPAVSPAPPTPPEEHPIAPPVPTPEIELDPTPAPKPSLGFDPHFLPVPVPLPNLQGKEAALLDYRHFSVAVNPDRKMPYYTAVNIDAVKYNALKSQIPSRKEMGADDWNVDPRIPKTEQVLKSFYSGNDFDLGHMVRREDPLWGDTLEEALAANDDTFYLTNAVPQHKDFNRNAQRWKGLEDYALKNARQYDLRVSVFSGCVFDENDRKLKGVQIPGKFFKILVMVKQNGELSATGYLVQQDDLIQDITERGLEFSYEQFKTYQVPLTKIEEMTGLQFGLNEYDPLQKTRDIFTEPKAIDEYDDIVL